jgi:hypothetical protein
MRCRFLATVSVACVFLFSFSLACAAPPAPAEYHVVLRYQIRAARAARLARFHDLLQQLARLGFRADEGMEEAAEDTEQTQLSGTIPAAGARRLFTIPQIRSALLAPADHPLPTDSDQRVRIECQLVPGLPLPQQRLLAEQTRTLMEVIGFREALGYDNRGHTRLVGTMPAGRVSLLLEDLRWQGSGWLAPQIPAYQLPEPLRSTWPLFATEYLPQPEGVPLARELPPAPPLPAAGDPTAKISPDLRALKDGKTPVRLEVILATLALADEEGWRRALSGAAPGLAIEGHAGSLVTVVARPTDAAALAQLPSVLTVRLPRPAIVQVLPPAGAGGDSRDALDAAGLERLHKLGKRGQGVRLAVVDDDFRGYREFLGNQLPARTRYVDVTAQTDRSILPRTPAGGDGVVGHGTRCALAAALAAPDAEITLIRVDREAPYQLEQVARYIHGEQVRSDALELRREELRADNAELERQRDALLRERRAVLDTFGQGEAASARREAYFKRQAELDAQDRELRQRERRLLRLEQDLRGLQKIDVVANALVWSDGYPLGGSSGLSRYFDDRPFRGALWFQATGDTGGQAWAGLFRDVDGNGVMEFAPLDAPLKPGRWTPELNFVGWEAAGSAQQKPRPKTRLRVSIQWREPHDATVARDAGDPFQRPLANLQLIVLRQRDPEGKRLPVDDLEPVARSVGLPLRLQARPSAVTYEQTVEFTAEAGGHYAVMLVGRVPPSTRPATEPTLPSMRTTWELWPRLFISEVGSPEQATGRPVFLDYATGLGSFGMPADAHHVLSVGAADLAGRPEPYSPEGPALHEELHPKPDLLSFDRLPLREASGARPATGLSAAFAAGLAASVISGGTPPAYLRESLLSRPGTLLEVAPAETSGGNR